MMVLLSPSAMVLPVSTSGRRSATCCLTVALSLSLAAPAWGQQRPEGDVRGRGLMVHAHTLEHQPASEAMPLVLSLLSAEGTVELRPGSNTLVIRDSLAAISRIVPMLRSFDHPARRLEVSLWLVEGGSAPSKTSVSGVPPPGDLLAQLRRHLPYSDYNLLAASEVNGREGDEVAFELPSGHRIRFRLGTVLGQQRIRLHSFEVAVGGQDDHEDSLVRANLFLWLGRTTVLSMAGNREPSRALMVVVRCRILAEEVAP